MSTTCYGGTGFVAILNRRGHRPDERVTTPVLARLGSADIVRVASSGPCLMAALERPGPGGARLVEDSRGIAVGILRLDTPPAVVRAAPPPNGRAHAEDHDSLAQVLDRVRDAGAEAPGRLIGDFALVVYDVTRHTLVAARDAFGIKTLFYAERADHLLVASHAGLLADGGYDEEYLSTFLVGNVTPTAHTIYAGVGRVPPGSVMVAAADRDLRISRYWTPRPAADAPQRLAEAAARFRDRFTSCVRTRIAGDGVTWAELSGGTDSSSVVVTAQGLADAGEAPPLGGTLTYTDSMGEANEQPFVEAVMARVTVPHVTVSDDWPWRDDGLPPPATDEPSPFYPFFARDRRRSRILHDTGSRALLSGIGSDHYLCGSSVWLADLLSRGRIVATARGCAAVAAAHRGSMWRVARRHALQPLAPSALRYHQARASDRLPSWVTPAFARRHDMRDRLTFMRVGRGDLPTRFQDAIAVQLAAVEHAVHYKVVTEPIELRYPFLDRELVELALGVPRDCIRQPGIDKVILREAMRGRLPETVRGRSTKGGIDARILWAFGHERERIDMLLRQSYLADMGAIDPACLRRAVEHARQGHVVNSAFLLSVLGLETWLAVRDGRWRVERTGRPDARPDAA